MLPWAVTILALLLAWAAWARAGRLARKLEALNQSYWELRYEFTRLRAHVARLDPEAPEEPSAAPSPSGQTVAFVPLASIRKKNA
jgi:hypothetical protein